MMWHVVGFDVCQCLSEAEQLNAERPLGRISEDDLLAARAEHGAVEAAFAIDGAAAGVSVLQVRGRVAPLVEHFLVAELVITGPVVKKVGKLQTADTDNLRNPFLFFTRESLLRRERS